MLRKRFNNHTVFLKASFGYCIAVIKEKSFIDKDKAHEIIHTLKPYYKEGYYRFFVVINKTVKFNLTTVEDLTIGFNHKKIQKIAFVDYSLGAFDRCLINTLVKIFYLKGSVEIKLFKNKKNAVKWLKI